MKTTDLQSVLNEFQNFHIAAKESRKIKDQTIEVSPDADREIFQSCILGKSAMRKQLGIRVSFNPEETKTYYRAFGPGGFLLNKLVIVVCRHKQY